MRARFTFIPIATVVAVLAYVALHPGHAIAEPRFADLKPGVIFEKATYELDKNHSSVYFNVLHLGLANVMGRFNTMDGTFVVDPANLTESKVEFSADIASIDTAIPARDKHLRSADFFEADKFPKLTFKGTKIEKRGDGYVINGDLTIKGKSKAISIPFKFFGPYKVPGFDMPPSIGVIAEPIIIKRSDFGVGGFDKFPDGVQGVSDEITVHISFEASEIK
jgi:polyisoprenoid-binding protein YceI